MPDLSSLRPVRRCGLARLPALTHAGLLSLALVLLVLGRPAAARQASERGNVLVLVADDVGVDCLGVYGLGSSLPATPNIDALAASGVLFRRAYANPICSPTRVTLQTGRYSFRYAIGTAIIDDGLELDPGTPNLLPRVLAELAPLRPRCAAIGKWHLGHPSGGDFHPNRCGYEHFAGTLGNIPPPDSYYQYRLVVDGVPLAMTNYATSQTVDDALAWIQSVPEPWVCYVAFQAAHQPFHAPPPGLFQVTLPPVDPRQEPRPFFEAAIEAMDTEIGRLLSSLPADVRARTDVIFLGDNGTPKEVTLPPFKPEHAKQTPYEGGIRVPLIISGPAATAMGTECSALVNTVDVFATVLELCGVPDLAQTPEPLDGISLVPYLHDPLMPSLRQFAFAEMFDPNLPTAQASRRSIVGARYKLIVRNGDPTLDELYDLRSDPFEEQNLLRAGSHPRLTQQERAAYEQLRLALLALLAS